MITCLMVLFVFVLENVLCDHLFSLLLRNMFVVSIGLFWFYSVSFSYNGVYFL